MNDCAVPLMLLYAEFHFRFFPFFPSLLFKRQPEIYFDMPRRIGPACDLPLVLLLNDCTKYPVEILEVTATCSQNGRTAIVLREQTPAVFKIDHPLAFSTDVFLFRIPRTFFAPGLFFVNAKVTVKIRNRIVSILNDNLFSSSKSGFAGFRAAEALPGSVWCLYGDLHVHSQFSASHVEFGPPIQIIDTMADAGGLSFFAVTDHSYDLACSPGNYLREDTIRNNGHLFMEEMHRIRATARSIIVTGEELSAVNRKGKVLHLGALGIRTLIPGNKDGARKRTKTYRFPVSTAVDLIKQQGGASFAAHPGVHMKLLQRMVLGRGNWSYDEISSGMDAFQIVNNGFSRSYYRARALWIRILLSARKLPIIAGNDAHGDFNRYRAVKKPFLSVYEDPNRYFGCAKTGIYTEGRNDTFRDQQCIVSALKQGKTFVTDGPFLCISRSSSPGDSCVSHVPVPRSVPSLFVIAVSTDEFGFLHILRIFRGQYSEKRERLLTLIPFHTAQAVSCAEEIAPDRDGSAGYIRAELVCRKAGSVETTALTSPCYLE